MWNAIAKHLSDTLSFDYKITEKSPVSGGNINESYLISDGQQRYFVKINHVSYLPTFLNELDGLSKLKATETVSVPEQITIGKAKQNAFLVLNYIPTKPLKDSPNSFQFGQQLAKLHQADIQPKYGFDSDNYLGVNEQPNRWHKKWHRFYVEQRIGWQLTLLEEKQLIIGDLSQICHATYEILKNHQPPASLLHGDLYHGNVANSPFGAICFDPACYYGDLECDLAMTELFGGFDRKFYEGYHSITPVSSEYSIRKQVYQLYHLLNHTNLFGGHYIQQTQDLAKQIVSQVR